MKVAHVELFQGDARLVPRYAVTATYGNQERKVQKIFSALREQRAKSRNNFITQYRMRYTIYIPLNAKDLTVDLTMHPYGNQQNAIKFARADNSDLLRALKHLTETSLSSFIQKHLPQPCSSLPSPQSSSMSQTQVLGTQALLLQVKSSLLHVFVQFSSDPSTQSSSPSHFQERGIHFLFDAHLQKIID